MSLPMSKSNSQRQIYADLAYGGGSFRKVSRIWITAILLLTGLASPARTESDVPNRSIDFSREILPLFVQKCFSCHSGEKPSSGIRLDRMSDLTSSHKAEAIIVPGDHRTGRLLRVVGGNNENATMPPEGPPLTTEEVDSIRAWIHAGASWSESDAIAIKDSHWAFQPIATPAIPELNDREKCDSPVDNFVLTHLREREEALAPPLEKGLLLRRLSLDLRGLPPTLEEIESFEADQSPDAYSRIIDQYLDSREFAERWAQHWLDLARYADTDGHYQDHDRPEAWRYRDWVIDAIDRDMPFDQFTIKQLAGDLLPNATTDDRIAAGFHRQTMHNSDACSIPEEDRYNRLVDRVNVTGSVWLGMTFGCAQCHDHKFDPVSQQDYFRMFAYFDRAEEVEAFFNEQSRIESLAELETLERQIELRKNKVRTSLVRDSEATANEPNSATSNDLNDWLLLGGGTILLCILAGSILGRRFSSANSLLIGVTWFRVTLLLCVVSIVTGAAFCWAAMSERVHIGSNVQRTLGQGIDSDSVEQSEFQRQLFRDATYLKLNGKKKEIEVYIDSMPRVLSFARDSEAEPTTIRIRGNYLAKGKTVAPRLPAILKTLESDTIDREQDRLDLAKALVAPANPLTARVVVNRIWQHLFGEGIVSSVDNFGVTSDPPVAPKLLDWLASKFISSGWSQKEIIRTIVLSKTYQQTVYLTGQHASPSPLRQKQIRLDAEAIRDSQLHLARRLELSDGGPGVRLPRYDVRHDQAESLPVASKPNMRRSIYVFRKRTELPQLFEEFDAPTRRVSCIVRDRSTTPGQALVLLNSELTLCCSVELADCTLREVGTDPDAIVSSLFRRITGRTPDAKEKQTVFELRQKIHVAYLEHPDAAERLVDFVDDLTDMNAIELATWGAVARILFNLDEAVNRP